MPLEKSPASFRQRGKVYRQQSGAKIGGTICSALRKVWPPDLATIASLDEEIVAAAAYITLRQLFPASQPAGP